ncbi:hypothetical protein L6164_037109 [Bauhinia variegata]|uniref:Uncharacterized protein n=1 Tax=Bauhinia variegata TaxID=167791 RepID=A0ACB9KJA5_BAUVA|nr:hypothetical protein L6164_037109 [Bauhinia variegata]
MKIIFLTLCLLFLSACRAAVVYDADGAPVINGGTYYLTSVSKDLFGGLVLATVGSDNCPQTVVLHPLFFPGWPVIIESPFLIPLIDSSFNISIRFESSSSEQKFWNVVPEVPFPIVKVSETHAFPFKIESAEGGFKIVYNNSAIGINLEDNSRPLVVNSTDPFVFMLTRVNQISAKMSMV